MKNKGEILAGILNDFGDCHFFLHNTKEKSIADKIFSEGFIFENQLPHSTDRVNPNEPIEVTYFLFQRKDYGSYTIIIAIPKATYEKYTLISNNNDVGIEEILSINKPYYSDNDELIYTISPKHILGCFNNKTGEFTLNKVYDSNHDSSIGKVFRKRLTSPDAG